MDLVTATELTRWADLREAQARLPQLVRRLIAATGNDLTKLSMRAGEGIGVPGWDGVVIAQSADRYVPEGVSVWEMGVNTDPAAKANEDYRKRKKDPGDKNPEETTYVFVTPRRWPKKDAWIKRKKKEGIWKDINVFDADDLEAWLERAPAVYAWISAILGKDPYEAESLETWWDSWSSATEPPLPPSLLLSGRDSEIEQIRETVEEAPTTLAVTSDSQEEVIAFIAAALISNVAQEAPSTLERTLIVRTPSAWRRITVSEQSLILLPLFERPDVSLAIRHRHTVLIPLGRETVSINGLELPRLRRWGIEKALKEAGLSDEKASTIATIGRRSLLSLRRKLAISPEVQTPEWSRPGNAREVLPAILAGKWQDSSDGDQTALSKLAGRPYNEFIEKLTKWANLSDPPVRNVGNTWIIAAKEDAWRLTARMLTRDDITRFQQVVQEVIGGDDPSLDLSPRERVMAPILGKQRPHSSYLIEGLADTLALMAATSEDVPLANDRRGQDVASTIIHELLEDANEDSTGRRWITLSSTLPLLAEAAPSIFLRAVEDGLRDSNLVVLKLFQDNDDFDFTFGSSAHPNLLWALEGLAWSPDYLAPSALLLAKLTRLAPRGRLANRPENSLRDVLLFWRPGTAATIEERLYVVEQIRKHEPEVAWPLILSLIPSGHDSASSTHTPRRREWKPESEGVPYVDLFKAVDQLSDFALQDVGTDGQRWANLLGRIADLSPETRTKIIDTIENLSADEFSDLDRAKLVSSLRDLVARHRDDAEAEWALPQSDLDRLDNLISELEPHDPAVKHSWLFSSGALYSFEGEDWNERRASLNKAQNEAVREIYDAVGVKGILSWSENFESSSFSAHKIGSALGTVDVSESDEVELFDALTSSTEPHQFVASAYISQTVHNCGTEWTSWVENVLNQWADEWSPSHQAAFLACLPRIPQIWDIAEELGKETDREYWHRIDYYETPDQGASFLRAVNKLLEYDRPHVVVDLLDANDSTHSPPLELIAVALEKALHTTPHKHYDMSMFSYHVQNHLDRLDNSDFDRNRLAELEWAYLLLFRFRERRSGVLYRELATNPSFFVDIVSHVYRAKGEEPKELSEQEEANIRIARNLLSSWRIVPGTQDDGSIDSKALHQWVKEARALLADCGRLEIGDHCIGEVLRYGPEPEKDKWPAKPIRDLIEEVASDDLERGFELEVYNSRGATTRGLTEGGKQERELAVRYRQFAAASLKDSPRTAAMLNRIAASYERDARRHDLDADLTEDLWR